MYFKSVQRNRTSYFRVALGSTLVMFEEGYTQTVCPYVWQTLILISGKIYQIGKIPPYTTGQSMEHLVYQEMQFYQ